MQTEPTNREYFVNLVNLYLQSRQVEQARKLAESVLKQVPDHPGGLELLKMFDRGSGE